MARGDKNYDQVVRKHNKGKTKSKARIKAVHTMVENLIQGDAEAAAEDLKVAVQLISREIILGEASDNETSNDAAENDSDLDDDDVRKTDDDLESKMDNDDDDDSEDDDDAVSNSKEATDEDADKKKKRHEDMDAVD